MRINEKEKKKVSGNAYSIIYCRNGNPSSGS